MRRVVRRFSGAFGRRFVDRSGGRKLFQALFRANRDPPSEIVIAEELKSHTVFAGLPLEAVAEIEAHPEEYPGVSVVRADRRAYPAGSSAAQVLGYVRATGPESQSVGQAGIERQYDTLLRGRLGLAIDRFDGRGRLLSTAIELRRAAGAISSSRSIRRWNARPNRCWTAAWRERVNLAADGGGPTSGGAIVAIDVRSGAILAAASALLRTLRLCR